jgi:LuxR family maltose regulon positive regulatory protein
MCGSLCDAVFGVGGWGSGDGNNAPPSTNPQPQSPNPQAYSQLLLQEIERVNLFLIPLDDERHWYRYHHLFVDVLRGRLTSGAAAESVATMHRRASLWFEEHGFVAEAVQHALAANDGDQAARLVELHGDTVWMHGGLATLLRWLTALPDTAFEARPKLALNHAFILMVLDGFALSERRLAAAERALHAEQLQDKILLGQAAGIRAGIALMADYPAEATIAAGRQALELLPESSTTWRGLAGNFLGCGYYAQAGKLDVGYQMLLEAEQVGLRAGDAFITSLSTTHIAMLLEIAGRLRESEQLNRYNLQRAAEPFWQGVPLAGYAHFGLGRVLYERNELHAARDHLLEAIVQLEAWSLKRPIVNTYVGLARVYLALGEPERAREWMDRAVAIVQKDDLKLTFSHWASHRVRMALAQGDMRPALQWAHEIEPTTRGELDPALEFKHITLAQVELAQQRLDDAQRLLARLLPAAQAAGRMGRVLAILVLQALTAQAQGDRTEAIATLERALALAEPEGYIRTFADHGAPMAALLAQVARGDSSVAAYAARLLEAFPEAMSDERRTLETAPPIHRSSLIVHPLVEPLSPRELEILRLIADGHSNQVIADRLVVAVSTVKKHVNNLYGKLDVQSRTQAIVRARELSLL